MNKKELNDNEIEKISGGTNTNKPEEKVKLLTDEGIEQLLDRPVMTFYGGPRPIDERILKIIRKEQNKDKEEPEKGKLSE